MIMENISNPTFDSIRSDRSVRTTVASESHYWFFNLYFSQYVNYETAPYQREMFEVSENQQVKLAVIVAFRGSGKSTIMTLSYPIWAVIGKQQKKFVLILSQTQAQARQHLVNLKRELEGNELLRADLGPLEEQSDEWGITTLVLPKYGAKITAASSETSIRGIRHGQYRPDLIIADDVEDLNSVKTREGRAKTFDWFSGEVIPCGDKYTKIIVVGNLLHEDSLLMKLRKSMEEKRLHGTFMGYPLVDDAEIIAWPGKFKTMEDIEELRLSISSDAAWQREFMLKIIADEDRVIHPDWIQYYDEFPPKNDRVMEFRYAATGVDLAISEKTSADCTAMVSGKVYGVDHDQVVYILPNPINERMDFPTTVAKAKALSVAIGNGEKTMLYVEDVAYQRSMIQTLKLDEFEVEGVKTGGLDKRSRLATTTPPIQAGKVLFPRHGCEALIQQLIGFPVEKHDDLADAFAILINKTIEENTGRAELITVGGGRYDYDDDDYNSYSTLRANHFLGRLRG
jgi:predicted phage terminase large subunit-like protein